MGLSSQSNEPSLNSSDEHLMTWDKLSQEFNATLDQHDLTLRVLSKNLEASESNGERLIRLFAELSQQNESLKTYNDQIGRRMQESDEWNAELQDKNVKLKAEVKVANANGLRNAIIAGVGGIALGFLIPFIIKLLRKFKIIP
jgi:hypothetical protein